MSTHAIALPRPVARPVGGRERAVFPAAVGVIGDETPPAATG
jgi:hypothetical protein